MLQHAWRFAANQHSGQLYPSTGQPYIMHLGQVLLELVPALAGQPDLDDQLALCCAILHDTIEDAAATADELGRKFGPAVMHGVVALGLSKSGAPDMQQCLDRVRSQPREVWLVKLASRIANMCMPPGHWSRGTCLAYADEAQLVLHTLGEASPYLAERLRSRIAVWRKL